MRKNIRLLAALLCLVMLFCIAGCGKSNKTTSDASTSSDDAGVLIGDFAEETVSGSAGTGSDTSGDASGNTSGGTQSGGNATGNPQSGGNTSGSTSGSDADPFANVPKRLKGTTIIFAKFGGTGGAQTKKHYELFKKKTGINVKEVSYNQGEYVAQVAKQIAAKSGPDVIICNDVFPSVLEIVQPLQNYFDLTDDFWDDEITEISTIRGNTYLVNSLEGIKQNIDAVFYNKSLFSNNGITSPLDYYNNGNWTYENFKKCAEEIKKAGHVGGYVDANKLNTGLGKPMIGYDPKTSTFKAAKSSDLVAGYQFAANLFKEGLWSTSDWWGTFGNGNIGLYVSGFWGAQIGGYFDNMDNNSLGMVPMPSSYKGQPCKPSGSFRGYGIAKGAKNPEAVSYFLRFILDYDYDLAVNTKYFKNKNVENMVFKILDDVKKTGRNFDFSNEAMTLAGTSNGNSALSDIRKADAAQVPGMLAAQQNVFDNAAKKANEKMKFVD